MADTYTFHDMVFTWLDGTTMLSDGGIIFGPVPKAVWSRYYPSDEQNRIPAKTDPILIQYHGKNYLIDASLGPDKMDEKAKRNNGIQRIGNIASSLTTLDLTREDIDVVMMTHMHNDHAGGLTFLEEGKLHSTYPNAIIYVQEKEWDDVRNPSDRTRNAYLKENWEPIQHQVQTFGERLEVAPGITMIHTGGHSRGHSLIRFEQQGKTLLHMADLLITSVQTNPLWVGGVDDYPMDSIAAKKKWMEEALANEYAFIFYHDPFYRVITYTKDGKAIQSAMPCSQESVIPMTGKQDKTHSYRG